MPLSEKDKIILRAKAELELRSRQKTTPTGTMEKIKATVTEGFPVSPGVQKAAQVIETPIRVGRAAALGAGELTKGSEPDVAASLLTPGKPVSPTTVVSMVSQLPEAIASFKRGLEPDFKPENTREEVLSVAGETAAILPITMPILALTVKHPGIGGAITFGTLKTIQQASQEGRIVPVEIAKEAAIAGALPALKPTVAMTRRAGKAVLKGLFTKSAKVDEEALDLLLENPKLFSEFSGLRNAITEKAINIQKAISIARSKVGTALNKYKSTVLNIKSDLDEPILQKVIRTPEQLDETFTMLETAIKNKSLPDNRLIEQAIELRNEIYGLVTFKPGSNLPPISDRITAQLKNRAGRLNNLIGTLKGGKNLRLLEKAYSNTTEIYENLQKKLNTPGKIEDFFVKFLKKEGDLDEILGTPGEIIAQLRNVERRAGMSIIKPMMQQLASRQLQELTPRGFSGSILAAIAAALAVTQRPLLASSVAVASSPRGAALVTQASQKIGQILQQASNIIARADVRSIVSSLHLLQGTKEGKQ